MQKQQMSIGFLSYIDDKDVQLKERPNKLKKRIENIDSVFIEILKPLWIKLWLYGGVCLYGEQRSKKINYL